MTKKPKGVFSTIPVVIRHNFYISSRDLLTSTALTTVKYSVASIVVGTALLLLSPNVHANPLGGTVAEGAATIVQETAKKVGITQHTAKAVIDWRSFNIAADEHTQFYQPSSSAIALNRITGGNPSEILGRLSANGRIMIVNPDGIVFGPNSHIDVAALVATTHDIRNDDFMAGRMNFTIAGNPKASIINQGHISIADEGIAAFVAPGVQNSGAIVARLGKVQLASANGFTLDLYGDGLIRLVVDDKVVERALDRDGNPLGALVDNTGTINADGGYVVLSANAARDVVNNVINTSGVIEARSVEQKNGTIILNGGDNGIVQVTGTLDASGKNAGETGGKVQVTGEKVGLLKTARIDVSGDTGGGTALIGGDYKGGNANAETIAKYGIHMEPNPIPTAQFTFMADTATINADALTNGKGGKVVVWSDDATRAYGTITARGGAKSGDGGFIETSGKNFLDVGQAAIASAANGTGGTWLLDPRNVTITSSTSNGSFDSGDPNIFTPFGDDSQVNVAAIQASLNAGTSVEIRAGSSGSQTGQVRINADITKTSGGDATFSIYAPWIYQVENYDVKSTSNKLNVLYEATDRVWIGRGFNGQSSNFITNGGDVTFHGPNFVGVHGNINAGSGTITIKAENGPNCTSGCDTGIWIYGDTVLTAAKILKITKSTLRVDQSVKQIENSLGRERPEIRDVALNTRTRDTVNKELISFTSFQPDGVTTPAVSEVVNSTVTQSIIENIIQNSPQLATYLTNKTVKGIITEALKIAVLRSSDTANNDIKKFTTVYFKTHSVVGKHVGKIGKNIALSFLYDFAGDLTEWVAKRNGSSDAVADFYKNLTKLVFQGVVEGPQAEAMSATVDIVESGTLLTISEFKNFNEGITQAEAISATADKMVQKFKPHSPKAIRILKIAAKERQNIVNIREEHPFVAVMSEIPGTLVNIIRYLPWGRSP